MNFVITNPSFFLAYLKYTNSEKYLSKFRKTISQGVYSDQTYRPTKIFVKIVCADRELSDTKSSHHTRNARRKSQTILCVSMSVFWC